MALKNRAIRKVGWFALPVGMYLLLALLYLWATPIGESPDEPGHIRCLEQVAIEKQLPRMVVLENKTINWWARENIFSDYMCYHMPLYYVAGGVWLRLASGLNGTPAPLELPPTNPNFNDTPGMFVHQADEPAQPLPWIILRLASILLGLVVLWGAAVVAVRVFPDEPVVALLAVTLIAGWPQFIFLSRSISNDMSATACAVAVLAILTDVGKPQRFAWAAFVAALAFLTKLSVAFTVGMVMAAWLVELLFLAEKRGRYGRPFLQMMVVFLALGLLVRFQPVIWANWQISLSDFSGNAAPVQQAAYWQQVYAWTQSSGWAWFGWLTVMPPAWHAQLWWLLIELAALVGLYVALKRPSPRQHRVLLLILGLWWLFVAFSYVRVTSNRWQPQFRFAFAVLPLLATFTAGGMLLPVALARRWQWHIWAGVLVALFLYNLWLIWQIILPAYAM